MEVPSVNELMNPILRAIRSLDGIASKRQISEEVTRDLELPPKVVAELRESGTETRLNTRLTMGLTYLKAYGSIDNPRRGMWVLTQRGQTSAEVDAATVASSYHSRLYSGQSADDPQEDSVDVEEVASENEDDDTSEVEDFKPRESVEIQALVARLGKTMGMDIWVPVRDRARVDATNENEGIGYLDTLPLSYDDEALKTIEQIDVLWVKRNYIERAFEIEHTTAIYSGILRMADLMALIPNMTIKLHIVAPDYRRKKVFREISRPVFRQLQGGLLTQSCTYISYGRFRDLSIMPSLRHMSPAVLDDYAESAN